MRILLLLIFIPFNVFSSEKERAMKEVQKACLAIPEVKKVKKKIERKIYKYIPVNRELAGTVTGIVYSISKGYIDTKVIKNLNINFINGNIRPDIKYNIRNKEINSTLALVWSF